MFFFFFSFFHSYNNIFSRKIIQIILDVPRYLRTEDVSSYLFDLSNPTASKRKIKFPASSLLHFGAHVCIIHHDISSVYRHGIRDTATIISSLLLVVSRRIVKAEFQKNLRLADIQQGQVDA